MPKRPRTIASLRKQHQPLPGECVLERQRRAQDPEQYAADKARSSARWQHLRASVLAEQPLCVHCLQCKRTRVAREVDHVVGAREAPDLIFDRSNLQPLCRQCHARKSARERQAKARRQGTPQAPHGPGS